MRARETFMTETFEQLTHGEALLTRELCEKEPHKWVGYVELPESDDEEEEVGVVLLKVGGKLISKGVPPEWIAWMYNAPPADGGPKKKAKRKKEKVAAITVSGSRLT